MFAVIVLVGYQAEDEEKMEESKAELSLPTDFLC